MSGLFQRLGLFSPAGVKRGARGSRLRAGAVHSCSGGGDGEDDDADDEYVPFIDSHNTSSSYPHHQMHHRLHYLSVDGRDVIPETDVATTLKHSKFFIGCNVLVTALTLMLVAVALVADARHRTSQWYRGAEYTVLFLLSLDLCVEISFQGCRRFGCSGVSSANGCGSGSGGGSSGGSGAAGSSSSARWCSFHRCLGCCLSWIQLLLFACSITLFYVVNFHHISTSGALAALNDEEEDADVMLGLMLTRYFLYLVLSVWHQWHACRIQGHLDHRSEWDVKFDNTV